MIEVAIRSRIRYDDPRYAIVTLEGRPEHNWCGARVEVYANGKRKAQAKIGAVNPTRSIVTLDGDPAEMAEIRKGDIVRIEDVLR